MTKTALECFNCKEKTFNVHMEMKTGQMLCELCIEKAMAVILTSRHNLVKWINNDETASKLKSDEVSE